MSSTDLIKCRYCKQKSMSFRRSDLYCPKCNKGSNGDWWVPVSQKPSADAQTASTHAPDTDSPSTVPADTPVPDYDPNDPAEYWIYVSDWDVGPKGTGPYRAVLHRSSCRFFEDRRHKEAGAGVKNYWMGPIRGRGNAMEAARKLHPWSYCSTCFPPTS
jgi:hypothetical protein